MAVVYVSVEQSEEEKAKRLNLEQTKADRENGKLEYFTAISEEGFLILF